MRNVFHPVTVPGHSWGLVEELIYMRQHQFISDVMLDQLIVIEGFINHPLVRTALEDESLDLVRAAWEDESLDLGPHK